MSLLLILLAYTLQAISGTAASDTITASRWASPGEFKNLPVPIKKELVRRGCSIPQPKSKATPLNVIEGHFGSAQQTDWAVLCSSNGYSVILMFWGGPEKCSSVINRKDDSVYMNNSGDPSAYSRMIYAATPAYIIQKAQISEPKYKLPVAITHDSLADYYIDKDEADLYCHRGKWLYVNSGH